MTTICFNIIKGGIGKTSIGILLIKYLARAGKKVLCIDSDPQNSSSFYFLDNKEVIEKHNYANALQSGSLKENIVSTKFDNIDIVPSSFSLVNLRAISEKTLKRLLPQIEEQYDFLIIDTAPAWDNIVLNAIHAADYIISPVKLAQFDYKGALFIRNQLIMDTDKVDDWYILFNFFRDPRTDNPENLTNQYLNLFNSSFTNILEVRIPDTRLVQRSIDTQEIISEAQGKRKLYKSIEKLANMFLEEKLSPEARRF